MKEFKIVFLFCVLFVVNGCLGTMMAGIGGPGTKTGPYGGVRNDCAILKDTYAPSDGNVRYGDVALFSVLMLIDLPLSFVFDTVLLPWTYDLPRDGRSLNAHDGLSSSYNERQNYVETGNVNGKNSAIQNVDGKKGEAELKKVKEEENKNFVNEVSSTL